MHHQGTGEEEQRLVLKWGDPCRFSSNNPQRNGWNQCPSSRNESSFNGKASDGETLKKARRYPGRKLMKRVLKRRIWLKGDGKFRLGWFENNLKTVPQDISAIGKYSTFFLIKNKKVSSWKNIKIIDFCTFLCFNFFFALRKRRTKSRLWRQAMDN